MTSMTIPSADEGRLLAIMKLAKDTGIWMEMVARRPDPCSFECGVGRGTEIDRNEQLGANTCDLLWHHPSP